MEVKMLNESVTLVCSAMVSKGGVCTKYKAVIYTSATVKRILSWTFFIVNCKSEELINLKTIYHRNKTYLTHHTIKSPNSYFIYAKEIGQ